MRKLTVLMTVIGLSAIAPLAAADTAQLELLPTVAGIERTQYIRDESPSAVANDDAFYARGTGGVSPQ
ncbi:MAG: hypothetical protein M5U08_15640 [Burkholderiales bacterium]|nr:hypothetical protein [Burkholderiales bacterium]